MSGCCSRLFALPGLAFVVLSRLKQNLSREAEIESSRRSNAVDSRFRQGPPSPDAQDGLEFIDTAPFCSLCIRIIRNSPS